MLKKKKKQQTLVSTAILIKTYAYWNEHYLSNSFQKFDCASEFQLHFTTRGLIALSFKLSSAILLSSKEHFSGQ